MATMVDVARIAGVSISTVSHVLNGTRNVEPKTRSRVLKAIEQTGYRQDTLARAMRRSKSDSIGLVVSDAGEPAFAEMVHGVEQEAAARGLTLLLANSAEDPERERRAVRTLLERRVDGLILACAAAATPSLLTDLQDEKTPVVLLDRLYRDLPFDQVGADNRDSMRALVRHLAAQGHRELLVIAGDVRVPALEERLDGFFDGVRDAQLDAGGQHIIQGTDRARIGDAIRVALADGNATAIIACSTPLAVAGLRALEDAGSEIPGDIAFATFDGFDNPDLFRPRLTTVRQPAFDMGVAAVRLLMERLDAPDSSPRTVRLHQDLQLRESTEGFGFPA
ncbi:LacI family transcriptional regulator [Microbacterium saccharophilum]|uniref:LacI family transcriptional regulator n=1 Tax=Microbacterium saccharophilum TaxID=1213358 RepID=A0A5C8HSL7_9MICO|nr:LacI family DNA-binding transcriptional regulator [Microbacterium saccharophilum]TXK08944.1 LacI family transcriptional regulator [Microbacterium saccharophilum]GEP48026.1 LacI family transcriptional regulator [Microbacterium saccharophilum]